MSPLHALTLLLVCDDPALESTVRAQVPQPHRVGQYERAGIVDERQALAPHGEAIVQMAQRADAVLVEWSLDRAPALNLLCYHVRRHVHAPVVMLCPPDPEVQAAALAAGADDALALPLSFSHLQARVLAYRRLVRAAQDAVAPPSSQGTAADVLRFGALRVDRTAHRFYVYDAEVELTPREFALVQHLIAHAGQLRTRDQILEHVWGITFDTGTNMVDVYMYFLRKKLEAHGLKGMIETVRGHGYRLVASPGAAA